MWFAQDRNMDEENNRESGNRLSPLWDLDLYGLIKAIQCREWIIVFKQMVLKWLPFCVTG